MGVLPTLFHEVSGQLFVKDNKTIIIRDFNYDGLGPGMYSHTRGHTYASAWVHTQCTCRANMILTNEQQTAYIIALFQAIPTQGCA